MRAEAADNKQHKLNKQERQLLNIDNAPQLIYMEPNIYTMMQPYRSYAPLTLWLNFAGRPNIRTAARQGHNIQGHIASGRNPSRTPLTL